MGQDTTTNALPKRLLDIKEVASYLNVPPATVRWWVFAGKISCYKIGRRLKFSEEDIEAFLKSNRRAEGGNGHIQ
ncbi:MAG: helix-turn-helix domain-containing protein [Candidatus Brocadiales bacterium]